MSFNELIRISGTIGVPFDSRKRIGSVLRQAWLAAPFARRLSWREEAPKGTCYAILSGWNFTETQTIDLSYSLTIEATEDPSFFGLFSPELEGFTEIGHSVEDCPYQAKWGMIEHLELMREEHLPIPPANPNPHVVIQNAPRTTAA